jgi:hypothetical protein
MAMTLLQVITLLYQQAISSKDYAGSSPGTVVKIDDPEHGLIDIIQIETTGEGDDRIVVIHTERS